MLCCCGLGRGCFPGYDRTEDHSSSDHLRHQNPSPWSISQLIVNPCKQGGRVTEPVYIPGQAIFPGSTDGLQRSYKTPENASPNVIMLCKRTSDTPCRQIGCHPGDRHTLPTCIYSDII